MPIFESSRRDDLAALQFDDVASQLDAGLAPDQIGGNPQDGDRLLVELMPRRQVQLDAVDEAVLVAAWQAGRGPAALRRLAETRRRRAELRRVIARGLRYPALLIGLATLIAALIGSAMHLYWLPVTVVTLVALGAVLAVVGRRALREGRPDWLRLPLLGDCVRGQGELAYLEILHALYASGVPLLQAHAQAAPVCPIASMRADLLAADALLQQGRSLHEVLTTAGALHDETRQLIGNGERAGNLEEALLRALQRRQDVAQRQIAQISRLATVCAQGFGMLVAAVTVLSFYASYSALLRGLR